MSAIWTLKVTNLAWKVEIVQLLPFSKKVLSLKYAKSFKKIQNQN